MKVEIFFSKYKYTKRKTKKTGNKSQIISIYGKATKKGKHKEGKCYSKVFWEKARKFKYILYEW